MSEIETKKISETKKIETGEIQTGRIETTESAARNAAYRAIDPKKKAARAAESAAELVSDFAEKHGFTLELRPDNAGRVVYGADKLTLEITFPEQTPATAGEEEVEDTHPFLSVMSKVSGSWFVTVGKDSYLFPSIDAADPVVDAYNITDLGNPLAVAGVGNAYLEGTRAASTDPWTVAVKYSAVGMTPDFGAATWQAEFDATAGWQKKFRYLLAAVTSDGGSGYEVVQRARSHMALILCAVNGRPAYLPTPL